MVLDENDYTTKSYVVNITIQDLIDEFQHKKLLIPRSNRAYAWSNPAKREDMIDTVVRGYPIGDVLFFRTIDPDNSRKEIKFIDDGQCRLRTIYSFVTGLPISIWNIDGTAPLPSEDHKPDPKYEVTYKGKKFSELSDKCKKAITCRTVSCSIYHSCDDVERQLIVMRRNNGTPMKFQDKVWSAKDLYPVKDAVDYFFDENGRCRKNLPWKIDKLSDGEKKRSVSANSVANATIIYFTAAYGHTLWEGYDKNKDEAMTKCLQRNYAMLNIALEKQIPINKQNTENTLDKFIKIVNLIKNGDPNKNKIKLWYKEQAKDASRHYRELWNIEKIGGFLLYNVMLDDKDPKNFSEDEMLELVDFCNTKGRDNNDLSPIDCLEKILKIDYEPFMFLEDDEIRRKKNDNFRCKHHYNWEDGLKNAKRCLVANREQTQAIQQ